VLEGGESHWWCDLADPAKLETLAKHLLSNDEVEHSVFCASTARDEMHAAAAYCSSLKRNNVPSRLYIARLYPIDCRGLSATFISCQGETGIEPVDSWHHDLKTHDHATRCEIVRRVAHALQHGDDRLRIISKLQIEHCMKRFLSTSDGFSATHAAIANCKKAMRIV